MILSCKESGRLFVTKTRMEEKRKEKRERELLRVYDSLVMFYSLLKQL